MHSSEPGEPSQAGPLETEAQPSPKPCFDVVICVYNKNVSFGIEKTVTSKSIKLLHTQISYLSF